MGHDGSSSSDFGEITSALFPGAGEGRLFLDCLEPGTVLRLEDFPCLLAQFIRR